MKFRTTIFLIVLLLGLSAAYVLKQRYEKDIVSRAVEAKRAFDFQVEDIESLEITQIGEVATAAQQTEANLWAMTKPNATIVASPVVWDRVAKVVAELHNERTITNVLGDVSQYGLDEPVLTVSVHTTAGEDIRLTFGYTEPTEQNRYAQLNDEMVFLVSNNSFFEMDRPLTMLRNFHVADDLEANILAFEYARIWTGEYTGAMENPPAIGEESSLIRVEREDAQSPWRVVSPVVGPANGELVTQLVNEIHFATGSGHIDDQEDLSDYGLDPASYRITIEDDRDGNRQTIFFGVTGTSQKASGRFAKREDRQAVFLMGLHLDTLLPIGPDSLREKKLITATSGELSSIHYRTDEDELLLELDTEGRWQVAIPEFDAPNQFTISSYIGKLKRLEVDRFLEVDLAEVQLDTPEVTLALKYKDGTAPSTLLLTPYAEDARYYAATQDTGDVTLILKTQVMGILASSSEFRSLDLLRFAREDVVLIEFGYNDEHFVLEKMHGVWLTRTADDEKLQNQTDAQVLIDAFTRLRAKGHELGENPEESSREKYGLESPKLSMTITTRTEGGSPTEVKHGPLVVGAQTDNPQQRYATVGHRSGVFRVDQGLIETVRDVVRGIPRPAGSA